MKKLAATFLFFLGLATTALAQGVDTTTAYPTVFPTVDGNYAMAIGPAQQVFWDDFGTGTLDTTNRWATSTGSGGVTATNAVGQTTLSTGVSANGFSVLKTIVTFSGRNPGFITSQHNINFEFPVQTNAYRAWGFFTNPGSPTTAAPLSNAVVFVVDTAGKLRAQTWGSGALNFDQDLSVSSNGPRLCNCVSQPADNKVHRYQIAFRGDNILWFIDGRPVAQVLTGAGGPDVNTLNAGALAIGGATPPSPAATLQINQMTLADTGNNSVQISDGTFSWRRATVGLDGTQAVSIGSATVASGIAGFPTASTPISGNAAGTTGAVVGTLAASVTKFTYICGFNVSAIGGTAAVGPITIAGLVGSSQVYQGSASAAGGTIATQTFTPCIPSSAINTAITTTTTADGTASAVNVNSWGYQQ